MLCELAKPRMKPVLSRAIDIPVNQHRLHVIVKDRLRRAGNGVEKPFMCFNQRSKLLILGKPHETQPAEPQSVDKSRKLVFIAPDRGPVNLGLFARFSGMQASPASQRAVSQTG